MNKSENTRNLLLAHYKKYPCLKIQDIFKFLYQSSFGCEHMITSLSAATDYIEKEYQNKSYKNDGFIDTLDGEYSRVPLSYLDNGLSAITLGKLFFASAKKEENGVKDLENKLDITKEMIKENLLPFSLTEFENAICEWKKNGYCSLHHSNEFREKYNPAYRVISNKFVTFLPLFARIDSMLKNGNVIVSIDGGSGSGKSTLSKMLENIYDCNVFHMDDFFLRTEQRTKERYMEVGGNIDYERFLEEILIPLSKNEVINYRKFDCSTMGLGDYNVVTPKKLTVIEGVYSMHRKFSKYYNLSVFLDISEELQKIRIEKRNTPELAKRFFDEWIPLENVYFSKMDVKNRCDIIIKI